MKYKDVLIIGGARTPIGKFQGTLKDIPATELGAIAIRGAVERAGIEPERVDEVLMGNVISAGLGQAPARQAAIRAGLANTINATGINKVCGSSLKTVMLGAAMIRSGDANTIVAGGMENMNRGPYLLPQARFGMRMGDQHALDATVHDGLIDPFINWHMGNAAEFIAQEMQVTRTDQDQFSYQSHQRALAAQREGKFKDEIVAVEIPGKRGVELYVTDETPRADTSLDVLAKLKPAFQEEGTVTAGNAPPLSDGGAAFVLVGEDQLNGRQAWARVAGYHQTGVEPKRIFWAPIAAIRGLVNKLGWKIEDVDLYELNEAFAAQTLADGRELGLDWNRVNVNGGAIALGHPIGASGARILVTLMYELRRRGGKRGIASACLGGGEAVAVAIEMI
ncbi:MAG: acetyl-CoA C-acetyltransferase [Anaerolineae bacterium]